MNTLIPNKPRQLYGNRRQTKQRLLDGTLDSQLVSVGLAYGVVE